MTLILHIRQLCNPETILFCTIITNTYIRSVITKLRAIFGIIINRSCVFHLLSISSRFYSMRTLQSEDKCSIIVFPFFYRLLSYHYLYYLHSMIECYILQRSILHYSLWWSSWSVIITILIERFIVYPCSEVQKSLSILYSFPVIFSYKNLIVDLQFGYSKDISMNGKSIIHVLSFHPLPYYSN